MSKIKFFRGHFIVEGQILSEKDLAYFLAKKWKTGYAIKASHEFAWKIRELDLIDYLDTRAKSVYKKFFKEIELKINLTKKLKNPPAITLDWTKFPPYAHQRDAIPRLINAERAALFADTGTGKTYIMLNVLQGLKNLGYPVKALVLCPKILIDNAWIRDTEKFTDLKAVSLRNKKAWKEDADIYVLNYESIESKSLGSSVQKLLDLGINTLILDESTKIKNPKAKRTKLVHKLAKNVERAYILTGTPAPNGIIDLWAQFYVIDFGVSLYPDFYYFRAKTHTPRQVTQTVVTYDPTPEGIELVTRRIKPLVLRYRKEDLKDLPEKVIEKIKVDLTSEQKKVYKELEEDFISYVNGEAVVVKVAVTKFMKLLQVTGGFVITESGEIQRFKKNPKLEALRDLIEMIDSQVIVWANFREEIRMIQEELSQYWESDFIDGSVSDKKRKQVLDRWRLGTLKILIAHPAAMGHGITLTESSYAIYYSLGYSLETYLQSMDRIHRIGQKNTCFYYHLVGKGTVDEYVMRSLREKKSLEDLILELKGN